MQACVVGMFELQEFSAFKQHLRDFLVQTKSFASQDNADLFAEEVAQQREVMVLVQMCALGGRPTESSGHLQEDEVIQFVHQFGQSRSQGCIARRTYCPSCLVRGGFC